MAVTSVNEYIDGRSGSEGDKGVREYRKVFIVTTNNAEDGPLTILTASGIPRRGDVWATGTELDSGAKCKTVTPDREPGAPKVWKVTAEWSSEFNPAEEEENPLLRPAVLTWDNSLFSKPATQTTTGGAIVNFAHEPFDPAPEMEDVRATLFIQKNILTYSETVAFAYTNKTNSVAWVGGAARTWKIQKISATSKNENDFSFWDVSFEFAYRPETWDLTILNQGFHHLNGTSVEVNMDTTVNAPYPGPRLLSTDGTMVSVGTAATFRTFIVYGTVDFHTLGLV